MGLNLDELRELLANSVHAVTPESAAEPKRGEEIFEGTDYPRTWDGFVGQAKAKEQLIVQAASAKARGTRIEHTLLASGVAGIGKSTLATLLAYQAGAGLVRTTGPLTVEDARRLIRGMSDGDILLIDEIHLLVQGGRNKADWILPFMTEGTLYTERGAEKMPDIAVVGATTDVGKLPETLISRFMCQPELVQYSDDEGRLIVLNLAGRMEVEIDSDSALQVARAADNNPRVMRRILTTIRDLKYAYPESHPNLEKAFEWSGVSADGLFKTARDILLVLATARDHTASVETIRGQLSEPGPIQMHEKALLQRGLIEITGRGRKLTEKGLGRAREEIRERVVA